MPKTFEPLHKVTRKNLSATGNGQNRTFFYARLGADTLLYIGTASEKKLTSDKVAAHLDRHGISLSKPLARLKWMSGTVLKQNDGKETYAFQRKKGTAKAEPIVELHLRKVFKDIAITGAKISLSAAAPAPAPRRDRQLVRTTVATDDHVSTVKLPPPPGHGGHTPPGHGGHEPSGHDGGGPSHPVHGHTGHLDVAGKVLKELAPQILSTVASAANAREELDSDDSTLVEKASSTIAAGGAATELTAHGVALATHAEEVRKLHSAASSASAGASSGGPPGHSPDAAHAHARHGLHAHKTAGHVIRTMDKVSEIAGDVAIGAGVVYSTAKAVRAGKELHDASAHKESLRQHIQHMKVVDALQKRFAGQEAPDIRTDPVVRSLVDRFKAEAREGRLEVGKKDVIDTLRLFVEIQTSSQKQSGVDLVANALKVAGGAATLSGAGAAAGTAVMLAGAGVQLTKIGIDKAVDHGREKKHEEEMALHSALETAQLGDEAQEKMAALVDTEKALIDQVSLTRSLRGQIRDKQRALRRLQQEIARKDEIHEAVLDVIDELGDWEDDEGPEVTDGDMDMLSEAELDALLSDEPDEPTSADVNALDLDELDALLADGDELDIDIDGEMGDMLDDIAATELHTELTALQAALRESLEESRLLREEHTALEQDINETVLPDIFAIQQQQRLEEILVGKARREKVTDGKSVGFVERLKHEASVNEDAAEGAMEERRRVAVDILLSGSIPPFLRMEMLAMLGIDEEGWSQLQEADEPARREALRLLMVV